MNRRRFSVIITSHNQRDFIVDAVDSAVRLRDALEVIVVDDASTDGSQDILRGYGDAIRFVALPANLGRGEARNSGAALAAGDFLVFLDGDDVLLPWALEVYDAIVETRSARLVLATMRWFEGNAAAFSCVEVAQEICYVEYQDYLAKDRSFGASASAIVIERRAFEAASGWSRLDVLEDQELLLRLGTLGPAVHVLSPRTVGHRQHTGQSVWRVPPFLDALGELIQQEAAGLYPGGPPRRGERLAVLGALAFFWSKRAVKAGLYMAAAKLVASTWALQLHAIILRARVAIAGRRRPQQLAFHRDSPLANARKVSVDQTPGDV